MCLMWLEFALGLWSWYLLSPGTPVFNSPQKQKISKILIRSGARFSKFTVTIKYLNQIPGIEAPVLANPVN